ncbi:hypothetical protein EYF80_022064 [Liparis tanakae]|uniref:Transmembrane protein n=1 Tax=Liparis tanakae TaxID=230148 RepID=A0A4Z2HPK5_9TELE|nr:hypothetical protein EYF80_022064 [Liparis tanakae]
MFPFGRKPVTTSVNSLSLEAVRTTAIIRLQLRVTFDSIRRKTSAVGHFVVPLGRTPRKNSKDQPDSVGPACPVSPSLSTLFFIFLIFLFFFLFPSNRSLSLFH